MARASVFFLLVVSFCFVSRSLTGGDPGLFASSVLCSVSRSFGRSRGRLFVQERRAWRWRRPRFFLVNVVFSLSVALPCSGGAPPL